MNYIALSGELTIPLGGVSSGPKPPTTVTGIKRLAKTLKRDSAIPHHQALDDAAARAGFRDFQHARQEIT